MFGVPPNTLPGYVHNDSLPLGILHYNICHSKKMQEGLMVFSNDFLHFLKIKKFICRIHQNYLVALILSPSLIKKIMLQILKVWRPVKNKWLNVNR